MTDNDFHLPRYRELPDVGLYLDQVVRYVNRYILNSAENQLTSSMVSNYVKQKIIPGPDKKSYGADSLACLIFVAYIKMVLPMEDIRMLIALQRRRGDAATVYDAFCDELEALVRSVYGAEGAALPECAPEHEILRTALLAVAYKLCLNRRLEALRSAAEQPEA